MIRQCQDWEQCCFSDWLHTLKGIVEGMCTCRAHVLEYIYNMREWNVWTDEYVIILWIDERCLHVLKSICQ